MAFQPPVDSFGICRLGFKCSWWHPRQANDAVASERSILAKITIIKVFPCRSEHVHTYISGSRCAWWQKITNRQTATHTYTSDNYSNPRCVHACRGLMIVCASFTAKSLTHYIAPSNSETINTVDNSKTDSNADVLAVQSH